MAEPAGGLRLYFIRHAQSAANVDGVFSNRGWRHPLTQFGRQQAAELAEALQPAGITRIYCSPLRRAVETAQILARRIPAEVTVTDALREYDVGAREGSPVAAGMFDYWRVERAWMLRGREDERHPGGECLADLRARFLPLLEQLRSDESHIQARVALVGHGGLFRCMLPLVLGNVDYMFAKEHALGHGQWVQVEDTPDGLLATRWKEMGWDAQHGWRSAA